MCMLTAAGKIVAEVQTSVCLSDLCIIFKAKIGSMTAKIFTDIIRET